MTSFAWPGADPTPEPVATPLRAPAPAEPPEPGHEAAELRDRVKREVAKAVVGHEEAVELMTVSAIAGGHILLEGPPGVAKTLIANAVAHTLGVSFNRIQFTPDTQPKHIAGETFLRMGEPVFAPGPVFANMLLADEINRTPPRTQAALLEAMQERQVTVEGHTHFLPTPFMVVATQNPFEREDGVFPLPESQLDRFLFKVEMRYGSAEQDLAMLLLPHAGLSPDLIGEIQPLMGAGRLVHAQREVDETHVPEPIARYVVALIRATREVPSVELGASPRAALHLLTAAKAAARLVGRDVVTRADVERMAPPVLGHRLMLKHGTPGEAVTAALSRAG